MSTQVYLNGKVVTISKSGGPTLNIPQYRCKFTLLGIAPVNTINDFTEVIFRDLITEETITDLLTEVKDSAGATVGDNIAVKAYLESFILLSDTLINPEEFATAANQNTIIVQNTDIDNELKELNIKTTDLERIKNLQKDNNKILNKIYNPE